MVTIITTITTIISCYSRIIINTITTVIPIVIIGMLTMITMNTKVLLFFYRSALNATNYIEEFVLGLRPSRRTAPAGGCSPVQTCGKPFATWPMQLSLV